MEATHSSETSVNFQRATRRYIPEDSTLLNHRCINLKSYMYDFRLEFQDGNYATKPRQIPEHSALQMFTFMYVV
jgi:hypothetical protein